MGLWSAASTSWNSQGHDIRGLPWNPRGTKESLRNMGLSVPREGLLHNMKRGVMEMTGFDNTGQGLVNVKAAGRASRNMSYGGGLFSSGGMREILHDARPASGGMFSLGARRTTKGMLGKFAGKALGPAFFFYQAATEGIGTAARDAVVFGSLFGMARWGLGKVGMGLFNPMTLGAAAIVGGIVGGRQALIAGRQYNKDVRKASFGNVASDVYGSAATLRQAGLQAIQSSKLNSRSALGSEASLMHM
jgi:hypothetical protein